MSQMTQLEDAVAYRGAVNQLRNDLWDLHGALEDLESFVERMERQAANGCRCAESVFATIDNFDGLGTRATVCKGCHDTWMSGQLVTYRKPKYLTGGRR